MMCSHQLCRHSFIEIHITSAIPVCRYHAVLSSLTKMGSSPCPKSSSRTRRDAGGWTVSGLKLQEQRCCTQQDCQPAAVQQPEIVQDDQNPAPFNGMKVWHPISLSACPWDTYGVNKNWSLRFHLGHPNKIHAILLNSNYKCCFTCRLKQALSGD